MEQFQIDKIYPKAEVYPMLLNFQNGYVTSNFKRKNCMLFRHDETGKKTVSTEINNIIYAGEEDVEDTGKTFFLARNRTTGKTRLIEIGVANLKPILKTDVDVSALLETSNLELSRKFGSKKQKQQMEQREKLKLNTETVTNQMLNITEVMTEETDKLDLSLYNKSDSDDFYIPKIDRTADKVEDVYNIYDILTEEEYKQIYSELQEQEDYTSDMSTIVSNIVSKKKIPEKLTVLAIYADSLMKLYGTKMVNISKKSFRTCPHSQTLNDIIFKNFTITSNGRRSRPTALKDKTLCHAIVMILLINNLKVEVDSLCQCTKLTANTIITKVKVTGASIVTAGGQKVVQLKLPLNTKSSFRRKSAKF